jgi:hypothetical protein
LKLGWPRERIVVVDGDQGVTCSWGFGQKSLRLDLM